MSPPLVHTHKQQVPQVHPGLSHKVRQEAQYERVELLARDRELTAQSASYLLVGG